MASRFAVVILSLWILHSSNAAYRNVRQDSPPLIKNCSTQEEQEFRRAFEQECLEVFDQAINFSNVSTILTQLPEPSHIVMLCSDTCLPSVLAHLRGCYGAHDGLALLYEDSCLFNQNGIMCYTATYNSLTKPPNQRWLVKAMAECYVNFTIFTTPVLASTCSDGCRDALRQVKTELGCCLNAIYNNSFVGEHLPFADYALWSNCGLESELPAFCGRPSAGMQLSGVFSLLVITVLGTTILGSV
jgi:hypothetical protein